MKIALLSIHYPPLKSSCAVQMRDLALELLQLGHEPIVMVPEEGLKRKVVSEMIDGIQVFRFPAFKTIDVGRIKRGLSEILLPFFMIYGIKKIQLSIKDFDTVIWYSPTIFFGPVVKFLKRSSNCRSYLILRDIFPEWAFDLGVLRKGVVYFLFKLVAKYQYSVADIIGVQTPSNLAYLENWSKKPNRQLEVLENWLSLAPIKNTQISFINNHFEGKKIFVYIGNMGVAQGVDIFMELAKILKNRQDIGFLFVGRGSESERLKSYAINRKLNNIIFHDEIDPVEIPGLLKMCHVGLVALDPRHKSHNIPGKFLAYMQAGLPVLARVNPDTDLAVLIKKEKVGYAYVGNEVDELQGLAEKLINNEKNLKIMSRNGVSLSSRMFSSSRAAKQIVSSLSKHK